MQDPNVQSYWRRTRALMLGMLAFWFLLAIMPPLLVVPLNALTLPILDIPLGFFLAAQGALIVFVIAAFWFARRQDRIDRDHFIAADP